MSNKTDCCGQHETHPDQLGQAEHKRLSDQVVKDGAAFFRAMGDETRFRILRFLDGGELCVCDLACLLNMSVSAVSHQLRALRELRLVKPRREGKNVFYTIADQHVHQMMLGCLEHAQEAHDSAE